MTDIQTETSFQCRHILTDGHRCGSPTLRNQNFCFYHHTSRRPILKGEAQDRKARRAAFELPRPEDRSAIQAAIGEILLRLAANQLDARRAGLLLYGLQIASINLPPRQPAADPADTVEEVESHPDHGLIALPQDYKTRAKHEKTLEEILHEDWAREEAHEHSQATSSSLADGNMDEEDEDEHEDENHSPSLLSNLQAVAQSECLVLCSPIAKDGVSSEARPLSPSQPGHPVPHSSQPHRDEWVHLNPHPSFRVPRPLQPQRKGWGIERSSTALLSQPRHPVPHSSQPHRDEWVHLNPIPPSECLVLCSPIAKDGVSSEARPLSPSQPGHPRAPFIAAPSR